MVLVQLIHVRLCLCGHLTHTRTILNRLSVLFHTFPRPGTWVVRRCNGRSCRRPRSWRGWRGWGWRGARSSRGSRHRGFGGSLCTKNMARDIKRPRATPLHVDTRRLFHFVYATRVVCDLFVFVDVSMIDVRRFHTFYTCCSQHRCVWLLDFSRCSLMPLWHDKVTTSVWETAKKAYFCSFISKSK